MNIIEQLRRDEGEKLFAYQDHMGYWTIGVGILIDKRKGGGITQQESDYLLNNRVKAKESELDKRIPWWRKLDPARQGVLLNMAFQMGVEGLMGFTNTLEMIRTGDYVGASSGMLKSLWAKQTPERAQRLANQMKTGTWQ